MILLSIIIPSFNRKKKLFNLINNIQKFFQNIFFEQYEILIVNSNSSELNIVNKNISIFNITEKLYPGIARDFGLKHASGNYIWFIDDDDDLNFENLSELLSILQEKKYDLIVHSLKNNYLNLNIKDDIIKNISLFKEKQEVFNFLVKKDILINNNIAFSSGLHEDIRYFLEVLIHSSNIKIFNKHVYIKLKSEDSITNKLTFERVDGYINALKEVLKLDNDFIKSNREKITIQVVGIILYLINSLQENDKKLYIKYLKDKLNENSIYLNLNKDEKTTNFKFAASLLSIENLELIVENLKYCFNSHISCKDLKSSLFFGPNKIIGCCKRFFYNGKMKGDVVLMSESNNITLEKILNRKKEIETQLNRDEFEECEGCPYLERFETKREEKINYISLENYTYCNMKCEYCSPKYYGGRDSLYDTYSILQDLVKGNYLSNKTHVVWGGGEPTLNPKFFEITSHLLNYSDIATIRILSNSLKFSNSLKDVINNDKIRIVTSIDAGTQNKFKQIRGRGEIVKVLENLKNYSNSIINQENLTIKYIITENNYESIELEEFVKLLKSFNFVNNFIQISCNFKIATPTKDMIFSIYELAARLLKNEFKFVYFDDLIRDRLYLSDTLTDEILNYLNNSNLNHPNIVSHKTNKKAILWGDGYQSEWIKNNTNFGRRGKINKIVSNKDEIIPEIDLIDENVVICPSAVQKLPDIFKQIKNSNLIEKTSFLIFL